MDPLRNAAPRAIVKPVVPDAVETPAEDFFRKPEPVPAPEPGDIAVAPADIAPAPTQTPAMPGLNADALLWKSRSLSPSRSALRSRTG